MKLITDDEPVLISDKELAELEAADGLDAGLDDFQYRDVVSDLIPALITRLRAAEDALLFYAEKSNYLGTGPVIASDEIRAKYANTEKGEKARAYFLFVGKNTKASK